MGKAPVMVSLGTAFYAISLGLLLGLSLFSAGLKDLITGENFMRPVVSLFVAIPLFENVILSLAAPFYC